MFNLAAANAESRQRRQRPLCWSPLARQPASKEAVGGGGSPVCNRLWGTNSSSPPLWSSSFDHLSNPGSAPPFASFFWQKWMSSVQIFSACTRRCRTEFENNADIVVCDLAGLTNTRLRALYNVIHMSSDPPESPRRLVKDLYKFGRKSSIKPFQYMFNRASFVLQKVSVCAALVFEILMIIAKVNLSPLWSKWAQNCLVVCALFVQQRFSFVPLYFLRYSCPFVSSDVTQSPILSKWAHFFGLCLFSASKGGWICETCSQTSRHMVHKSSEWSHLFCAAKLFIWEALWQPLIQSISAQRGLIFFSYDIKIRFLNFFLASLSTKHTFKNNKITDKKQHKPNWNLKCNFTHLGPVQRSYSGNNEKPTTDIEGQEEGLGGRILTFTCTLLASGGFQGLIGCTR